MVYTTFILRSIFSRGSLAVFSSDIYIFFFFSSQVLQGSVSNSVCNVSLLSRRMKKLFDSLIVVVWIRLFLTLRYPCCCHYPVIMVIIIIIIVVNVISIIITIIIIINIVNIIFSFYFNVLSMLLVSSSIIIIQSSIITIIVIITRTQWLCICSIT